MCKVAQGKGATITNTWTCSQDHQGYRCKTIKKGNATVLIYRPTLDRAEQEKRENHVRTVVETQLKNFLERR